MPRVPFAQRVRARYVAAHRSALSMCQPWACQSSIGLLLVCRIPSLTCPSCDSAGGRAIFSLDLAPEQSPQGTFFAVRDSPAHPEVRNIAFFGFLRTPRCVGHFFETICLTVSWFLPGRGARKHRSREFAHPEVRGPAVVARKSPCGGLGFPRWCGAGLVGVDLVPVEAAHASDSGRIGTSSSEANSRLAGTRCSLKRTGSGSDRRGSRNGGISAFLRHVLGV